MKDLTAPQLVGEVLARLHRSGEELPELAAVNECHKCFDDGERVELQALSDGIICPRCGWCR